MNFKNGHPRLPASETHFGLNFLAVLLSVLVLVCIAIYRPEWDNFFRCLVVMASSILLSMFVDIWGRKTHLHPAAALNSWHDKSYRRVAIKTFGIYAMFTLSGLMYHLFPVYASSFYHPYWQFLSLTMPWIILLTPLYVAYMDRRMDDPIDGHYHMGLACLMRIRACDGKEIKLLCRAWLIKAFFLPLMFVYLLQNVTAFSNIDWQHIAGFKQWYEALSNTLFLVDLLFASTGYIVTMRLVNAHIRSTEPTFFGWFIALICYAPFWDNVFYKQYFSYDEHGGFLVWTSTYPFFMYALGISILLLLTIYVLATIAMGYRFSNLTYRGLVSNGPYRFTKHPAYVAKNLSWWLVALPFLSQESTADAIQNSVLLLGVNLIYYLRAKTEEAHLSRFPEYVAYATAINECSIFAPLARLSPALRYTPAPSYKQCNAL